MEIPKLLKKDNKKYLLDKIYPNYALYTNLRTGKKECFTLHELGSIKEMVEPPKYDLNVEKVKI